MLRYKILLLIVMAPMLILSGCGNGAADMQKGVSEQQLDQGPILIVPEQQADEDPIPSAPENATNQDSAHSGTDKPPEGVDKPDADDSAAEVVVKTDTKVSDEKAAEVLNEIDREMDNLINILNNMDDVSEANVE